MENCTKIVFFSEMSPSIFLSLPPRKICQNKIAQKRPITKQAKHWPISGPTLGEDGYKKEITTAHKLPPLQKNLWSFGFCSRSPIINRWFFRCQAPMDLFSKRYHIVWVDSSSLLRCQLATIWHWKTVLRQLLGDFLPSFSSFLRRRKKLARCGPGKIGERSRKRGSNGLVKMWQGSLLKVLVSTMTFFHACFRFEPFMNDFLVMANSVRVFLRASNVCLASVSLKEILTPFSFKSKVPKWRVETASYSRMSKPFISTRLLFSYLKFLSFRAWIREKVFVLHNLRIFSSSSSVYFYKRWLWRRAN